MTKIKKVKDYQDLVVSYYIKKNKYNKELFEFLNKVATLSTRLYNQIIWWSKCLYDHNQIIPKDTKKNGLFNDLLNMESPYNFYKQIQQLANDDFASMTSITHFGSIQSFLELKKTQGLNGIPQFPRYKEFDESDITKQPKRTFASRLGHNSIKPLVNINTDNKTNRHSKYYMVILKRKNIQLPFPPKYLEYFNGLQEKDVKEMRFVYITNQKYKIEVCIQKHFIDHKLDPNRILFIDLGEKNFVTGITNDPTIYPFILDGKPILAINHRVQERSRRVIDDNMNIPLLLQPVHIRERKKLLKKGIIGQIQQKIDLLVDNNIIRESVKSETKIIRNMRQKRKRMLKDIFDKYGNFILEFCIRFNLGTISIGENQGWKQNTKQNKGKDGNRKFGKTQTRIFQYIPYTDFKFKLAYRSKINTIQYYPIEESYTSQTDHLSGESLEFHPSNKIEGNKRNMYKKDKNGKQIHNHHLFHSSMIIHSIKGVVINADVNGSMGIARKYCQNNFIPEINFQQHVDLRTIFTPIRVKYKDLIQPKSTFDWDRFQLELQNKKICSEHQMKQLRIE